MFFVCLIMVFLLIICGFFVVGVGVGVGVGVVVGIIVFGDIFVWLLVCWLFDVWCFEGGSILVDLVIDMDVGMIMGRIFWMIGIKDVIVWNSLCVFGMYICRGVVMIK